MHASQAEPTDTARGYVQDLERALTARGLVAKGYLADGTSPFLWARNPSDDRLTQVVVLRDENGELAWCWQWMGKAETGGGVELEFMCPAAAISDAAANISRVLALAAT